jgi:mannosyltransferase
MASREAARAARPVAPAPPPGAPRSRTARLAWYWPAAAAAAVMLALGLWGLARDSAMGNDEVATRWAALLSLPQLAHLLRNLDAVHGAYYLFMHGWMVVGTSPLVMRIPSLIGMTLAAGLVAVIGRRLSGSAWIGLVAGLVTALTPAISYYAQTARSYALVFASVTAATLALIWALGRRGEPAPRRWLAYGALITVSGYLNELALLVLTAHAVTVLLARYGRAAFLRWARAAVIGAVLVVPVVVVSSRETGAVTWISRPDAASLGLLYHDYFGATLAVSIALIICAVAALLPPLPGEEAGDEPGPAWWRASGVSLPSVAAPLLIVPAVLLIAESLVARPFYVDRYVLFGEAGAALLAGAGVLRIGRWLAGRAGTSRRRAVIAVPAALLCVGCLVLQLGAQRLDRTPGSRQFNFGGPSAYLAARARPGDAVLYFGAFYRKARLGYPQDYRNLADVGLAVTPQAAGTFQGTEANWAVTGPALLRYQRVWTVGRPPRAPYPPGLLRAQARELDADYTYVRRAAFRGVIVTLWVRDR